MLENDNNYEKIENANNIEEVKNPQVENQLVIYKENKVLNFIRKILEFFRRKHTNQLCFFLFVEKNIEMLYNNSCEKEKIYEYSK